MYEVRESAGKKSYGPSYDGPRGGIAHFGSGQFNHRFGGDSWMIREAAPIHGGASLVMVLDLSDPLCSMFCENRVGELPIPSYLSCDIWTSPQFYRVDYQHRVITLVERREPVSEVFFPELCPPLPESPLILLPMTDLDLPSSEEKYWGVVDMFVGGDRFLRVCGPPLWIDWPLKMMCDCGREMPYVVGMGYPGSKYESIGGVFIGEAVLYWFFCRACNVIGVTCQST